MRVVRESADNSTLKVKYPKNEGIVEFYERDNVSFGISYEDNDDEKECYIYNLFIVDTGEYINIPGQSSIEDPTPADIVSELVEEFNELCDK